MAPKHPYKRQANEHKLLVELIELNVSQTKRSPHPVSLGECIRDDGQSHGCHHAQVREGKVDHKHVGGRPEPLDLKEDVADTAIAKEVDEPEEDIADAHNVVDERMLRRELSPVIINDLHGHLVNSI